MSNDSSSVTEAPERETRPRKLPWSPLLAVIYAAAVFLVAQFIAGVLIVLYAGLKGWTAQQASDWVAHSVAAQFWYVLLAEALTFGAIWWFLRRRKVGLQTIGWVPFRPSAILYALGGFAIYFVSYLIVLAVVQALVPSLNVEQEQNLGFNNVTGTVGLILTFISLVILPPLVEETVFRGFIFTSLFSRMKVIFAALITSALFAVAHLQFGSGQPLLWVAGIDTFVLSMVLCYLRFKTGSLWPAVILHAIKNSIAFVVVYVLALS